MTRYLSLVLLIFILSCDSENSVDCCTNIDTELSIHYINEAGENLVNSTEEFDQANIRIYFKDGEIFKYAYNNRLDLPNYHQVIDIDDQLVIRLFPSDLYEGEFSTTLIELTANLVDTIVTQFEFTNGVQAKKVWVNGKEMDHRHFTLLR